MSRGTTAARICKHMQLKQLPVDDDDDDATCDIFGSGYSRLD